IAPPAVLNTLAATLGDPREPAPAPTPVSPATRVIDAKHYEELPANFSAYLSNLPLLHSWDGGVSWNTGGFQPEHLADLYRLLREKLPPSPMLLETGAGNSTICLLFLHPRRLVSIAPEAALFDRIRA